MRKLLLSIVIVAVFGSGCVQKDETAQSGAGAVPSPIASGGHPAVEVDSDAPTAQGAPIVYVNVEMQQLHERNERAFLQALGFGMARVLSMPTMPDEILAMKDASEWRIYKTELLGIAEHDQPVVMSSIDAVTAEHHFAEVSRATAPTPSLPEAIADEQKQMVDSAKAYAESARKRVRERALNDFEMTALERMNSGETGPWMAEAPDRGAGCFRMMAAIRARQECLKCHSDNKEGDALGAFVYLLEQVAPAKVNVDESELLSSR